MGTIASQITNLTTVYSTVYSDADQRKYQSCASLAFVRGIHRGPVNSPHKWPVTRKMFPFDDVIMKSNNWSHGDISRCFVVFSKLIVKTFDKYLQLIGTNLNLGLSVIEAYALFIRRFPYPFYNCSLKTISWWRHQMETFSALLALCMGNSPVTGEFPSQRPLMRVFDVFFDLRLKKRLSKHSRG